MLEFRFKETYVVAKPEKMKNYTLFLMYPFLQISFFLLFLASFIKVSTVNLQLGFFDE